MSYTYNDSAMMIATQIAYLDFEGDNTNVGEHVDAILETYGVYKDGKWKLKPGNWSTKQEEQFNTAKNIVKLSSKKGGNEDWRNWNVVDVCNDQNDTGYYGMLIDTGDGNAIVGCRGSESTDLSTGYKDWGEADLGLLDNELTAQQEKAEAYMERIWQKYGSQYDGFSFTGHSLGGNLATHMVITAPAAIRDKIEHCISFDGPGFSEEYIEAHKDDIAKVSGVIDHYQWSWVSSLLNPLPGVKDTIIKAHDDPNAKNDIKAMLWRHATTNVELDENGNIIVGDESVLSTILGPISRFIENVSFEELQILGTFFPLAVGLTKGIKLLAAAVSKFRELKQQCVNLGKQVYYNYIAPKVSGTYEINLLSVSNMADEVFQAESRLQAISDDIEAIRRNLKYWSATGGYYRSSLYILRNGLENDLKKLKKMGKVAEKAVTRYSTVDNQVKVSFQ